jgi:predicted permease
MSSVTRELALVVRKLIRTPGFTVIAVLTLAVGIGANTAIFSVVDGVVLKPLPYPDADELVGLWHTAPGLDLPQFEQSNTTYTLYRERAQSFEEIGLVGRRTMTLTGEGEPVRLSVGTATASLFRTFRLTPALGRTFSEDEDDPGAPQLAVLSHALWTERFGADGGVLGRGITLDGEPYEVIGVMPAGFRYPNDVTEIWVPHVIGPEDLGLASFSPWAIARLKPGVSVESAAAELNQILPRLPEEYPGEITAGMMANVRMAATINLMKEDVVGDVGQLLWILLGTVSFVLLIAVANVANLFLVRAEGRQREMAVRTALGAGRGDLIRAYLTESTVLSAVGGIVGIGLALGGVKLLVAMGPENLPRLGEIGVYGSVLIFTGLVSLLAGLLFGAVPALKYGRPNLGVALKEGGRGGSVGKETHRANNSLVAAQVALALMLLIGSGLMARSFIELRSVHPGFDAENVLTLNLALIPTEIESPEQAAGSFQRLLDDIRGLPGVVEAGASTSLPLQGGWSNNAMVVETRPLQEDEVPPVVRTNMVAPGYFEAMGIRLVEGRTIERRDHERRTGSVVVSRELADRYWPGESALGKRVSPSLSVEVEGETPWFTVVGVVDDVRDDGLAHEPPAMIYYPLVGLNGESDWTIGRLFLTIQTSGDPLATLPAVRERVRALDSRLPVANVGTAADLVRDSAARMSFTLVMLGIAAGVALLLGTVGVYGVISYIVSRRIHEFGIRMAMGAADGQIRSMVVRQGLAVAGIGVAVGLAGGLVLTRLMQALLFGVSATDPLTFGAVSVALLGVSALASYIPARRASAVGPAEALRHE